MSLETLSSTVKQEDNLAKKAGFGTRILKKNARL
jgi:hypothetical protein